MKQNQEWAAKFDEEIGPFEEKYKGLTSEIQGLYDNAKLEHMKGLEVLISFDFTFLQKRLFAALVRMFYYLFAILFHSISQKEEKKAANNFNSMGNPKLSNYLLQFL